MKHFRNLSDIPDLENALNTALELKTQTKSRRGYGKGRTLCLLFFNPSLRTRLSTQKAARNLGMDVVVMNVGDDGWSLETADGAIMNQGPAEHIREAARVVGLYADLIGVRAFSGLKDRDEDQRQVILEGFVRHSGRPVINLESPLAHPLQALADGLTLKEKFGLKRPRVVLSWAPHPRALPHAVPLSFIELMKRYPADFAITHPPGYELDPELTSGIPVYHDQKKALEGADAVYVKNWSAWEPYGQILPGDRSSWMLTEAKLGKAWFMHCLPVRRNVIVEDAVLDGERHLFLEQALNRVYAAQYVIKSLLDEA